MVVAALYRRVEVGLFNSRTKAHKSLQALQGATRHPRSIEYLVYRAASPNARLGAGQTQTWKMAMEEALDTILRKAAPRQLAIVGLRPFPRPDLLSLDLRNLCDLYLRVGIQTAASTKIYGELLVMVLPQLRSLSLDELDLIMPLAKDDTLHCLRPMRLQKLEIPWHTKMVANFLGILHDPTYIPSIARAASTIIQASSGTLKYLDVSGLQRNIARGITDWPLDLSGLKHLTDLYYMLHSDEAAWTMQLAGLSSLANLTRMTIHARYTTPRDTYLKGFVELVLQLKGQDRLPVNLQLLDCTSLRIAEDESYLTPAGAYGYHPWYRALLALQITAESSNLKVFLFEPPEVQLDQLIGLCIRETASD